MPRPVRRSLAPPYLVRNPLPACRDKIARASEHLERIGAGADRFLESGAYAFVPKYKAKTFYVDIFSEVLIEPSPRFGVIVGEFAHNLSSCLDHLTWALVVRHLKRVPDKREAHDIQFPISNRFLDFKSTKVLPYLPEDARAIIQSRQPYRRRYKHLIAAHPLADLRRWSNTDKHRAVHLMYVVPDLEEIERSIRIIPEAQLVKIGLRVKPGWPLEQGTHVARIYFSRSGVDPFVSLQAGKPYVNMEGEFSSYITFDETPPRDDMEPTTEVVEYVSETVDLLEPLITKLPW